MNWIIELLQSPTGVGASLGAGSSPFILAILFHKLVPIGSYKDAMSEKDKQIEEVKSNAAAREKIITDQLARTDEMLSNERQAKETERERADDATTRLANLAHELGATSAHLLEGLRGEDDNGGGNDAGSAK